MLQIVILDVALTIFGFCIGHPRQGRIWGVQGGLAPLLPSISIRKVRRREEKEVNEEKIMKREEEE